MFLRRFFTLIGLLLAIMIRPALAEGFVIPDQYVEPTHNLGLAERGRCSSSPYALYGRRCHQELNFNFERPIMFLTLLDKAALFVYKYHKLKLSRTVLDNTKVKFELNLKNIYRQEARARLELRYRFSSALPDFRTPTALAPPPAAESFAVN